MVTSLSRKILLVYLVVFLLLLLRMSGMIFAQLILTPSAIFDGFELWRLVTYPLVPGFLDLLIVAVCFSIPGDEVENLLGTRYYGLLLLGVVLFAAALHLAVFAGQPNIPLMGPMNPALFVLVGYVYLFPKSDVRLFFFSVSAKLICLVLVAITVINAVWDVTQGASVFSAFEEGLLGIVLGAAYFHARYQKYPFLLKPIRSMERIATLNRYTPEEEMSAATQRRAAVRRSAQPQPGRARGGAQKGTPGEISDEERLNLILDKINEKSYNALTEEEKRFLRDYSGRL